MAIGVPFALIIRSGQQTQNYIFWHIWKKKCTANCGVSSNRSLMYPFLGICWDYWTSVLYNTPLSLSKTVQKCKFWNISRKKRKLINDCNYLPKQIATIYAIIVTANNFPNPFPFYSVVFSLMVRFNRCYLKWHNKKKTINKMLHMYDAGLT